MNVIDVNKVMDEKMGTICFTGHRPNRLAGYNSRAPYTMFVRKLKQIPALSQEVHRGLTSLHSGLLKD